MPSGTQRNVVLAARKLADIEELVALYPQIMPVAVQVDVKSR